MAMPDSPQPPAPQSPPAARRPRRRVLRIVLIAIAVLIVVPAVGVAILISRFNPDAYKPQIIAAVKSATGRTLTLGGPIQLGIALRPTLELSNVALSNPPGFSRPEMLTLQKLDVRLALLPLLDHKVVIARLVLIHPDIKLETNQQGATNWQFTPESGSGGAPTSPAAAPAPAAAQAQAASGGSMPLSIAVRNLSMKSGTLTLADDKTGKVTTLALRDLQMNSVGADAPLDIDADAAFNGLPFALHGSIGSLTRLQDAASRAPWPVALRLSAGDATLDVQGSLTDPGQGRGYALRLTADLPSLGLVGKVVPSLASLPPLTKLHLAATVADRGAKLPEISALVFTAGAADLTGLVPGLKLDQLEVHAPEPGTPITLSASASRGGVPVALTATLGPLNAIMPGLAPAHPAPFPVDASVSAGSGAAAAALTVKGSIADAPKLTGVDLALAGQIPDLGALSLLAGRPLPTLKTLTLAARIADTGQGLAKGVAISDLTLSTPQADLAGSVQLALAGRPALTADLHAKSIDADALLAALAVAPTLTPPPPPPPAAPPPGTPAPVPARAVSRTMIPDTPLPWPLLRRDDADVKLAVGTLRLHGQTTRDIALHLVLKGGKLTLDPFAAVLPQGKLSGSLTADANPAAPPVALKLTAPGLAVAALLKAAGMTGYATGNLEVRADLHGTGVSPHAIVASLDGSLGLAMQGGSIDRVALGNLLGGVLSQINALSQGKIGGGSSVSQIQCFALRGNFSHGVGTIDPLLLESSLLTMSGTGTVSLGPETLDMHLRPEGKVAGTVLVFPMHVSGSLARPGTSLDALGAAEANAGTVAGTALGVATGLGPLAGLLGADKMLSGSNPCPQALAAARFGAAPAASAASSAKPAAQPAAKPKAGLGGFLKKLFP